MSAKRRVQVQCRRDTAAAFLKANLSLPLGARRVEAFSFLCLSVEFPAMMRDELAALPEYLSNHVRCPRASVSACFGGDNGLDPSSRAIIDALRINTADLVDDEEKKRS